LSGTDARRAIGLLHQAVEESAAAGDVIRVMAAANLADPLLVVGDAVAARHWANVALAADQGVVANSLVGLPLLNLGSAELMLGDVDAAMRSLDAALLLAEWANDELLCAAELIPVACVAAVRGQPRRAAVLYAGQRHHMERLSGADGPAERMLAKQHLGDVARQLGEQVHAELCDIGRLLTLGELIEIGLGVRGAPPLDRDLPSDWRPLAASRQRRAQG
jgi:hypothetical protein